MNYHNVKTIFTLVLSFMFALAITGNASGLNEDILLSDNFNGDSLNNSLWYFDTNSAGSGYSVADGILTIFPGYSHGGGGSIVSHERYVLSDDILVFECEGIFTGENAVAWGFQADDFDGIVNFMYAPSTSEFYAHTRPTRSSVPYTTVIPNVDVMTWHVYRLEVTRESAKFFIDGELKTTLTENLPLEKSMHVRLDTSAWPALGQPAKYDYVTVSKIEYEPIVSAKVNIDPDVLNLKSNGRWITTYIELPTGYDVTDIDTSTVMLDNAIPAENNPIEISDSDEDGIPDLMIKFNRQVLIEYLNDTTGEITLKISGELDGMAFEGSDTVTVIKSGK